MLLYYILLLYYFINDLYILQLCITFIISIRPNKVKYVSAETCFNLFCPNKHNCRMLGEYKHIAATIVEGIPFTQLCVGSVYMTYWFFMHEHSYVIYTQHYIIWYKSMQELAMQHYIIFNIKSSCNTATLLFMAKYCKCVN